MLNTLKLYRQIQNNVSNQLVTKKEVRLHNEAALLNKSEQSIVSTNTSKNLENAFPSVYECCFMSLDAYNTENDKDAPVGWTCYRIAELNVLGYFGKCFIKDWNTPYAKLAFAHRGTVFTDLLNIVGDLELAFKLAPEQCLQAYNFVITCMMDLGLCAGDKFNPICTVTHTGHSLGAVIADTMTGILAADPQVDTSLQRNVTFENPGSKQPLIVFWERIIDKGYIPNILNFLQVRGLAYQANWNIINTCNEQAVKTFRLEVSEFNYDGSAAGMSFPPNVHYAMNLSYLVDNTEDQHPIARKIDAIKKGNFSSHEFASPFGFNNGYVAFLDFSLNQNYWIGFFKKYWEKSIEMHLKFNNDYDKYYSWCCSELDKVHQEAKSLQNILPDKIFDNEMTFFKPAENHEKNVIINNSLVDDLLTKDFILVDETTDKDEASAFHSKLCVLV